MKRRDILKAGSGALALSGMLVGQAQAAVTAAPVAATELKAFAWSRAMASSMVGQTFWLNHPERRALALVLKGVMSPKNKQPRLEQFSLVFDSAEAGIAAGTYEFDNTRAGRFSMHLVPLAPTRNNKRYRADFSLLA